MELSQLTAYAKEKYNIDEQHKWDGFKSFSVLCEPSTGKWAALLMRQWDGESGVMIELCDIKCGREVLSELSAPYLSPPFRMHGNKWVGVKIDSDTDAETVFRLFDKAVGACIRRGSIIVLADALPKKQAYTETALPVRSAEWVAPVITIPEKIREMTALYEYGDGLMQQKSKNFYVQGKFMEDYEDNAPWFGELNRYFTTYHDLRLAQLRGYFTWRTELRKGNFQPISASLAYIYIYELLNGVGVSSPEESLQKLKAFETDFIDSGTVDGGMRHNIRRWMTELAVVKAVAPELAVKYFDEAQTAQDNALAVLKNANEHSDAEVFDALCAMTSARLKKSPVITKHGDEGIRLFAEIWRSMLLRKAPDGKSFFESCFGCMKTLRWYPLSNAVYWQAEPFADAEYPVNEVHGYYCKDGLWFERLYPRLYFSKTLPNDFVRETDRLLRIYLKTGKALKQRESVSWAEPFINEVINADRQAKIEAAKPKITIRFSQLEQIRQDASVTRDSLLTEEELRQDAEDVTKTEAANAESKADCGILNAIQLQIMRALLKGADISAIIAEHRLMPSILADEINEALFDEIGDTVLDCDGANLSIIEDYKDDLLSLLNIEE